MSKSWKLKTNSSNILLVLITLIYIKAEWCVGKKNEPRQNNIVDVKNYHILDSNLNNGNQLYVGHDEIAQFFFNSTKNNNFLILYNLNKCVKNFSFVTCLKLFLLENLNSFKINLNKLNDEKKDVIFLNGLLTFKMKSDVNNVNLRKINDNDSDNDSDDDNNNSSLDDEILNKIFKIFQNRLLRVNLNSKFKMDITPTIKNEGKEKNICFTYKFLEDLESEHGNVEKGRKKKSRFPMMLLPQLLMLGFLPFTLASLKSMVMNAVLINMMALNGAIFMLIRDLVFGNRPNSNVQYVNYGYSKDRQKQRKRPVLIIHSSAAFVKQPKVYHTKDTSGNYNFQKTNYFENYDALHNNFHHSFDNKNDFTRPIFQSNHDNKNQHNFHEKHADSIIHRVNMTAYQQQANKNFVGKSGNEIKKTDKYVQNSPNNYEINKPNSSNNYFNTNNKYSAKLNQRTLILKTKINNHQSSEIKPKHKFSSKILSLPLSTEKIQENTIEKAKTTSKIT